MSRKPERQRTKRAAVSRLTNARRAQLISSAGVHLNQIYGWKKQVLDNVASLFARGASALGDGEEEHERETAKLYTKIGQLTVIRPAILTP